MTTQTRTETPSDPNDLRDQVRARYGSIAARVAETVQAGGESTLGAQQESSSGSAAARLARTERVAVVTSRAYALDRQASMRSRRRASPRRVSRVGAAVSTPAVPATRRRPPAWVSRQVLLLVLSGAGLGLGFLAGALEWSPLLTRGFYLFGILAGMLEIAPEGLRGVLRERSLDINFLVTVAVIGAVGLGEWSEAATVVFLFSAGEAIESFTFARTRRSIQALMAIAPATARVKHDGHEDEVPVEDVEVGSVVVVRPGDRIPLDGEIVAGESSVDQAPITGESVPVDKTAGDAVYAATINHSGYLEIRTSKPFHENTLARIIQLVESAQGEKAPSQQFVEKFARVYTPAVVAGAVLLALVPWLAFGQELVPWFNRALVLLLVACPCALVVSTPVSVVAAIGNASRNGVLIKGGQYLENAGTVKVVALDKTGTLTRGVPEVQRVYPLGGLNEAELLRLAAAAEARSEHPLAKAVLRAARRAGVRDLPPADAFRAAAGSGVTARVEQTTLLIGKAAWVAEAGAPLTPAHETLAALAAAGHTAILVARDGAGGAPPELVGLLAVADELRPGAADTVRRLRAMDLERIVLLTGDNDATARTVATQVGIGAGDVYADLLPEDKARTVRELQRRHKTVAMVGDGVNDAPALAAATVGIAMGTGGSDVALETADVALVADDLSKLPWVLELSHRAARTIRVNVALALGIKAIVLVLAALGIANLWLAIAADTGASVLVSMNGMRLLGKVSLPKGEDVAALRRRYRLGEHDEHAGHAH
ncbi:MAG TPA: heavy metal translocating P-type ATPase [Chloroflexota bacterium]|nr:heavy metal translocating P-type ATPase [Chloroflexota bacterium]